MKAKQWCHLNEKSHCGTFDTVYGPAGPDRISRPFLFILCADLKKKKFAQYGKCGLVAYVPVLLKSTKLSVELCGHKFHVGLMIILTEQLNRAPTHEGFIWWIASIKYVLKAELTNSSSLLLFVISNLPDFFQDHKKFWRMFMLFSTIMKVDGYQVYGYQVYKNSKSSKKKRFSSCEHKSITTLDTSNVQSKIYVVIHLLLKSSLTAWTSFTFVVHTKSVWTFRYK